MTYLLDTDTYDHLQRANASVLSRISVVGSENVAITIVTRIEVLRARFEYLRTAATATHLRTAQHWLDESDRLLSTWRIVRIDEVACKQFEQLREIKNLRKIGRADLLIACIVLANRATLVSRNIRDFKLLAGLRFENWVD